MRAVKWLSLILGLGLVIYAARWVLPIATIIGSAFFHWFFHTSAPTIDAKSVNDRATFFRLQAKYLHGDEPVDFDLVVGCAVRVTDYRDNSSSYDAFRDPVVYAKATRDGGAVAQIVPSACAGETTANGEVPQDFLPGALWLESKDDFSLGIAYVTEDAYDNPKSKLKFLGATISKATREEWEQFRPVAAQNLLQSKEFTYLAPWPSEADVKAHLWDKAKLAEWARSSFECHAIARFQLTDPKAREVLRQYWPVSKPRYWSPGYPVLTELIGKLRLGGETVVDGHQIEDYTLYPQGKGFPTRVRGGQFRSGKPWSRLPPPIYPLRAEDGVPWARPDLRSADSLYRDVDYNGGTNLGFAYCYSPYWGRGALGELHLPDYFHHKFVTRVDGEALQLQGLPGPSVAAIPAFFFENDDHVLVYYSFGLS